MELITKLVKFCLVGASGMVIDFSVTFLLKERFQWHRYLSSATGFILASASNFIFNRSWTFNNHEPAILSQYSLFLLFALIGLGINTLFLMVFERLKFSFYVAKFFAIVVTMAWNFSANYLFTFSVD